MNNLGTYDNIIGFNELKEDINNYIKLGIGEVFLFRGVPGSGKRTVARAIAGEHNLQFVETNNLTENLIKSNIKSIFYYKLSKKHFNIVDSLKDGSESRRKFICNNNVIKSLTLWAETYKVIIIITSDIGTFTRSKNTKLYKVCNFMKPNRIDRNEYFIRQGFSQDLATILVNNTKNYLYSDMKALIKEIILIGGSFNEDNVYYALNKISDINYGYDNNLSSEIDKTRTAYHEIGHLMVAYLVKGASKPRFITILNNPRVELGLNDTSVEDKTKTDHLTNIMVTYAGVVFEDYYLGEYSTGCYHDFQEINLTIDLMQKLHMVEKSRISLSHILKDVKNKTIKIIEDHSELIDNVYNVLIEKNRLNEKEINELIGLSLQGSVEVTF